MSPRIASSLAVGAFFPLVLGVVTYQRLAYLDPLVQDSRSTVGTIVRIKPHDHGKRVYRYAVDGKPYEAEAGGGPEAVGALVTVYYRPKDPQHSMIDGPPLAHRERLVRESWHAYPQVGGLMALLAWATFPLLTRVRAARDRSPREGAST